MTRCAACDECFGYCSCANEEPVRWRLSEQESWVWDFNLLTIVEEEMEEHE